MDEGGEETDLVVDLQEHVFQVGLLQGLPEKRAIVMMDMSSYGEF